MTDDAMPEELDERTKEELAAQQAAILEAVSSTIAEKIKKAVDARSASGIETVWKEDEDHYEGIDDSNRGNVTLIKPRTIGGVVTTSESARPQQTRSTVFLKITRPYVDAAAARLSDLLLPNDDRNFAVVHTPVPDMIARLDDTTPIKDDQGNIVTETTGSLEREAGKGFMSAMSKMLRGGVKVEQKPLTVGDAAQKEIERAREAADKAQNQIDDWLVECRYHGEARKLIHRAAKIGTGIVKGPVPAMKRKRAAIKGEDGSWALKIKDDLIPEAREVNPWNFFPDGSCGDDIQNGSYVVERDDITRRRLAELRDDPSYLADQIDACLREGPVKRDGNGKGARNDKTDDDQFEIWYFTGTIKREELAACGCEDADDDQEEYPAIVTMVNNRAIKAAVSPMDSGEFPYSVMNWQRVDGSWAGNGVARQMRECQKGVNAGVRNIMDNAGLSAGPILLTDRNKIEPADGRWELTPRKQYWTKPGVEMRDAREAITSINIQSMQADLMAIVQFWLKQAEDVTGMPMLLQGQLGTAPDTVGGMTMLNNNATAVLRAIARNFDDQITETLIGRFYEWLLLFGPDECKGDFTIDARGSSALVERDSQSQALVQMIALSKDPAFGLDPELVIKEVLAGMRFDIARLEMSEEKKAKLAEQSGQVADPRIMAAQINADARLKGIQMTLGQQAQESDKDRAMEQWLAQIDAKLKVAGLTAEERQNLNDAKTVLSTTVMKLNTQKALSLGGGGRQVVTPPTEPVGRAPDGMAFQQ